MKTQTQPKHAQEQWKVFNAFARFEIRENEDDRQNIAEVYDEANAQRIVKCVNNEWKIDMHNELVKALNDARSLLNRHVHYKIGEHEYSEEDKKSFRTIRELLKQSE